VQEAGLLGLPQAAPAALQACQATQQLLRASQR